MLAILFALSSLAESRSCIEWNHLLQSQIATGQLAAGEQTVSAAVGDGSRHLTPACAGLLLNDLAGATLTSGQLKKAESLSLRAINRLKEDFPSADPVFLYPLNILATAQLEQGAIGKARETVRKMQAIRPATALGEALVCATGAALLSREEKWKAAEADFLRTLAALASGGITESTSYAASILSGLAKVYLEEGRYADAVVTVDRALAALDSAKDAIPLDRVKLLARRGLVRARQGRWKDAEDDFRQAVAMARLETQADPAELIPLAKNYAFVLRKSHRKTEAQSIEIWCAALQSRRAPAEGTVDVTELRKRK